MQRFEIDGHETAIKVGYLPSYKVAVTSGFRDSLNVRAHEVSHAVGMSFKERRTSIVEVEV